VKDAGEEVLMLSSVGDTTSHPLLDALTVNCVVLGLLVVTVTAEVVSPDGYANEMELWFGTRVPLEPLPVPTVKFTGIESGVPPPTGVTVIVARYVVLLTSPAALAVTVSKVGVVDVMTFCPDANATISQVLSVVGLDRVTAVWLEVLMETVVVAVL
jgi:hypothetical protein